MMRSAALVTVLLLAGSCQTYDFERVVPLAVAQTTDKTIVASKRLKPNVMLLVDNSGSMLLPTDPNVAACPADCGNSVTNLCPPTCPTRVTEMKSAMSSFLQTSGTIARLGLTVFPAGSVCEASSDIREQLPAETKSDDGTDSALTGKAQSINARLQALVPTGGTPTGGSLEFVGTYGGLNQSSDVNNDFREDFVLLLTDGLPNCNPTNANSICGCVGPPNTCSAAQVTSCDCTLRGGCSNAFCAQGCLDQAGVVEKVRALRLKGIRTIVVGFGADTAAGSGPLVLNAMALAGGFPRECPNATDAECGGTAGSCNTSTKQCSTSFFQAATGAELASALRKISEAFQGDPCVFSLSARPSDPRYLAVVIDQQSVAEGSATFSYDPNSNKVTFLAGLCDRIKASTPQAPVNVEFRIVERF